MAQPLKPGAARARRAHGVRVSDEAIAAIASAGSAIGSELRGGAIGWREAARLILEDLAARPGDLLQAIADAAAAEDARR